MRSNPLNEYVYYDNGTPVSNNVTYSNNSTQNTNTSVSDLSYADLVDSVQQNNAWSAEQAQRQMDFQRELYERSLDYNSNEAAIDRAFQQESANRAMEFSSAEAQANRDWQEYMSNTAHQREMADLQAAGLNPILAANNGAATGSGATASSAQAAGHAASSSGVPSGSKGDADKSATAAIASLLGKMLDNQIEREKMNLSAETARETADLYTAATRYAAELSMLANQYSADRHLEGTVYSADSSYNSYLNNPFNLIGNEIREFLDAFNARGYSAQKAGGNSAGLLDYLVNLVKNGGNNSNYESSYERTLRYIDTGGTGNKEIRVSDSKLAGWLKSLFS